MNHDTSKMSAEARKLVELTTKDTGSSENKPDFSGTEIGKVLKEHPDLISGLDEYMAWRDKENHTAGQAVGETKNKSPISHEIQVRLNKLRKKKGK